MMVDRIDGFLNPADLATIALAAGFNPETGNFSGVPIYETTEGEDARLQAQADAMAVKPPLDEADDRVIEEAVEQPVEKMEKKSLEEAEAAVASGAKPVEAAMPDEGKAMLWSPGMPVNVLQADELKQGKIVGVHPPKLGTGVQLTVEFEDGEVATVDEDEVEAV